MSDRPYLMQCPERDELWLIDGDLRILIRPELYDLLVNNGAELPDAYGIKELREQNAKLRELVKSMYYDLTHMTFPPDWVTDYEADMRELGVEVE